MRMFVFIIFSAQALAALASFITMVQSNYPRERSPQTIFWDLFSFVVSLLWGFWAVYLLWLK